MPVFSSSKWIWFSDNASSDEYGEFFSEFVLSDTKNTVCRISCDGDYTLYVNGKFVASNQYGDYEHYKIYDEIALSDFVSPGKNRISVVVWHFGDNSSRYVSATAGVIFEILADDSTVCVSSEQTYSRISPTFESGRCRRITPQLGYGFHYDKSRDDGSLFTGVGFGKAVAVDKNCTFYKRIGEKLKIAQKEKDATLTKGNAGKYYLIDLSEETVGLLRLKFTSPCVQKVRIDWGEHLDRGHVRRIIGTRDFSVEYTARSGENDYTNYMLRLGARYMEIYTEKPIELDYAGIIPQYYPTKTKEVTLDNALDRKIYDLCVNTLKLSMMEHYVDCPWREQALYVYDSRNQMLSGYYAFENGNAEYAYSNLKLISQDRRYNGLLSICYPTGKKQAIPSFSLHYFTAVLEHYEHTGNIDALKEIYPKLLSILSAFKANKVDGLVYTFVGDDHWNFYDWSEHLQDPKPRSNGGRPDSIINLLYLIALRRLGKISEIIGEEFDYKSESEELTVLIKKTFFNERDGLFSFKKDNNDYTELANSLAIIAGVANGELAHKICEKMLNGRVTESSLSLKCFMYDALLMTSRDYASAVIEEIRKNYGYMLSSGATSAWETIKGADDFGGAGSLCHGWSAIPIYYYHKLGLAK